MVQVLLVVQVLDSAMVLVQAAALAGLVGREGLAALFVLEVLVVLAILEVQGSPLPVGLGLAVQVPHKPAHKMRKIRDMTAGNLALLRTPQCNLTLKAKK